MIPTTNKFAYQWGTGNIPVYIFMRVKEFSDDSHPDPNQRIHLYWFIQLAVEKFLPG